MDVLETGHLEWPYRCTQGFCYHVQDLVDSNVYRILVCTYSVAGDRSSEPHFLLFWHEKAPDPLDYIPPQGDPHPFGYLGASPRKECPPSEGEAYDLREVARREMQSLL